MEVFFTIIEILEIILVVMIGYTGFKEKIKVTTYNSALILMVFLVSSFGTRMGVDYQIKYVLIMVLTALIYKADNKGVVKSFAMSVLGWLSSVVIEFLLMLIFGLIGLTADIIVGNFLLRIATSVSYIGGLYITFKILKYYKIDISRLIPRKIHNRYLFSVVLLGSIELFLVTLLNTSSLISNINPNYHFVTEKNAWIYHILILIVFILLSASLSLYIKSVIRYVEGETERPYVRNMSELITMLRSVKHDAANHYSVIYHLIKTAPKEAISYIQGLLQDITDTTEMIAEVKNVAVSALLQSKKEKCKDEGINCKIVVKSTWQLKQIKTTDLITVLANVIDNAIEATSDNQNQGTKEVQVWWLEENGTEIIEIINSGTITNMSSEIFELGYTTKEKGTGTGLPVVKKIVGRYKGVINVSSTERHTKFKLMFRRPIA